MIVKSDHSAEKLVLDLRWYEFPQQAHEGDGIFSSL